LLTKLNIPKTSFYLEETMNALQLTEYMDFMTNANVDIILNFGKRLAIALIVFQLQH
jgi:hypothetical protein